MSVSLVTLDSSTMLVTSPASVHQLVHPVTRAHIEACQMTRVRAARPIRPPFLLVQLVSSNVSVMKDTSKLPLVARLLLALLIPKECLFLMDAPVMRHTLGPSYLQRNLHITQALAQQCNVLRHSRVR